MISTSSLPAYFALCCRLPTAPANSAPQGRVLTTSHLSHAMLCFGHLSPPPPCPFPSCLLAPGSLSASWSSLSLPACLSHCFHPMWEACATRWGPVLMSPCPTPNLKVASVQGGLCVPQSLADACGFSVLVLWVVTLWWDNMVFLLSLFKKKKLLLNYSWHNVILLSDVGHSDCTDLYVTHTWSYHSNPVLLTGVSRPQPCCDFEWDHSSWRGVLCTVGCWAAVLASTH